MHTIAKWLHQQNRNETAAVVVAGASTNALWQLWDSVIAAESSALQLDTEAWHTLHAAETKLRKAKSSRFSSQRPKREETNALKCLAVTPNIEITALERFQAAKHCHESKMFKTHLKDTKNIEKNTLKCVAPQLWVHRPVKVQRKDVITHKACWAENQFQNGFDHWSLSLFSFAQTTEEWCNCWRNETPKFICCKKWALQWGWTTLHDSGWVGYEHWVDWSVCLSIVCLYPVVVRRPDRSTPGPFSLHPPSTFIVDNEVILDPRFTLPKESDARCPSFTLSDSPLFSLLCEWSRY